MQFHEREVTVELKTRPLRLVYLICSKQDLIDSVTLYTHVWGGADNVILPLPKNNVEVDTLKLALKSLNPDYIFISEQETPLNLFRVLEQFPVQLLPVSREGVNRLVNEPNFISCLAVGRQNGTLPHIVPILASLHLPPPSDSKIRLIEPGSPFDFELALQGGIPTQSYQNGLKKHFSARVLPSPKTAEQLVKVSMLIAQYTNPVSLTLLELSRREFPVDSYNIRMEDIKTLYLFLSDGEDISVAVAFWNARRLNGQYNKLFLPREAFLSNIERHCALILEVMPSIHALFITTPFDKDNALNLGNFLKNAFAAVGGNIQVEVFYRNFSFNFIKGTAYCGQPVITTKMVASDGSIRFNPPAPPGHENRGFVFSYDAEVVLASGRRLFIPDSRTAASLVSNRLEEIEFADNNPEMQSLRRQSAVRAAAKGITGTALAGRECRVYIPTGDVLITRQFKAAGFEIKPNKHTRYAQGFVKRLGGFEKTRLFVNQNGLSIISTLRHPQAKEGGFNFQQLREFMSQSGMSKEEAGNLLEQQLPLLLSSGLVRRGYSLTCPHCDLSGWYPIKDVGEFVECVGCAQSFQLGLKRLEFTYQPNKLASRFMEEGGKAVLMTAEILYQLEPSAFIKFGGDILRPAEQRPFAEVDFLWLAGDTFVLAECKSYYKIEKKEITDINKALENTLQVAISVDAQVAVLGVVTSSCKISDLFTTVTEFVQRFKEKRTGLHLVLNGKLYLFGSEEVIEPWSFDPKWLQLDETVLEQKHSVSVGELSRELALGDSARLFDDAVLHSWEHEMNYPGG